MPDIYPELRAFMEQEQELLLFRSTSETEISNFGKYYLLDKHKDLVNTHLNQAQVLSLAAEGGFRLNGLPLL